MPKNAETYSDAVLSFIVECLNDSIVSSVLDPWVTNPQWLATVAKATKATKVRANLSATETTIQPTDTFSGQDYELAWTRNEALDWLSEDPNQFDVVVSELLLPSEPFASIPNLKIRADLTEVLLLGATRTLTREGVGFFIVSSDFIKPDKPQSLYCNMSQLSLYIDAIFYIPIGTFEDLRNEAALVIVKHSKPEFLFVGELSAVKHKNNILLTNYKNRTQAKTTALGSLILFEDFKGYRFLAAEQNAQEAAKSYGLQIIKLADAAVEVDLVDVGELSSIEERPNTLYLPLNLNGDAGTFVSELSSKFEYAQIVLNPDIVIAAYAAGFFNTVAGRIVRKRIPVNAGSVRQAILRLDIYLPTPKDQVMAIETDNQIANLMSDLQALKSQLWSQPNNQSQILKDLQSINRKEIFEQWLYTIPFPLASILWKYYASSGDDKKQYDMLLRFFEACTQYFATVLLSGFVNNTELLKKEQEALARLDNPPFSLDMSTFGTWVRVVERMISSVTKMLNATDNFKQVEQMFKATQDTLIGVFPREIVQLLQQTNVLRNEWKGHGGIDDAKAPERRVILEEHLLRIRNLLGQNWSNYRLIRPVRMTLEGGNYHHHVELLMGMTTPFKIIELETVQPMDKKYLYLHMPGERQVLQLVPLIKVIDNPPDISNGCYFYSRVEGDKLHFVSHHFEAQPDMTDGFPDLEAAFQIIWPGFRTSANKVE